MKPVPKVKKPKKMHDRTLDKLWRVCYTGDIMDNDQWLTVQQVMEKLQVSDETIYRRIRSGELKAVRFGSLWRIPPTVLEEFLKGGKQK